jgi:LysM repeat protein
VAQRGGEALRDFLDRRSQGLDQVVSSRAATGGRPRLTIVEGDGSHNSDTGGDRAGTPSSGLPVREPGVFGWRPMAASDRAADGWAATAGDRAADGWAVGGSAVGDWLAARDGAADGRAANGWMAASGRAVDGRAASRRPVRLTRRGRLVLLALLLMVCGVAAIVAAGPGQASDPAPPPTTAVVQPGDTLWSFAERNLSGTSPYPAIDDLRRLNHLDGYVIHPGQRLVLPRRR